MRLYPIADRVPTIEKLRLGCRRSPFGFVSQDDLRAVYNYEKRNPKKGEWFLSGAIPEAYRARSDMDCRFSIARLVRVRTVKFEEIVQQ